MILPDKALHIFLSGAIKPLHTINWAKNTLQKVLHSDRPKQKAQISRWSCLDRKWNHDTWMVFQNKIKGTEHFYIQNKKYLLIKLKSSYMKSLEASHFHEKKPKPKPNKSQKTQTTKKPPKQNKTLSKYCLKLIFGTEERVKKVIKL